MLKNVLIPIVVVITAVVVVIMAIIGGGTSAAASGYTSVAGFYGESIQEKVWWALKDAGFNNYQVAGAMGNIEQESSFNPASGSTSACIGLCQWKMEYLGGDLKSYADSKGVGWEDEDTQLEFLVAWLANTGPAVDYINRSNGPKEGMENTYNGTSYPANSWAQFKSTGDKDADIEYCTMAYCANYERCGEGEANFSHRIDKAKEYYEKFYNKKKPQGGSESGSKTAGIRGYYKSAWSGRTFTEYYQNVPGSPWYWDQGCWVCSQATIMSGFGSKYTPNQLPGFNGLAQQYTWQQYGGVNYERVTDVKASDMINYVKKGQALHIRVEGGSTLTTDNGSWSFSGHSLTILDYKKEGGKDKLYIHDPWKGDACWGWGDASTIASALSWYEHVWK